MRRRQILALLASATVAGCASRDDVPRTALRDDTITPPENVEVVTEAKEYPELPESLDAESAREFVAGHEEALVHNELIGAEERAVEVSGWDYPTSVEVEDATTHVVHEGETGFYVLSSCSGRAEYYCERKDENRSCGRSSGRNAHAVAHFVGEDDHVRIPYNWFACERADEPHASDDSAENVELDDHERSARLNVYDFSGWKPTVEVTITHEESGDVALRETYDLSLPLTVQPDVTRRTGTYEVVADVAGATATAEWTVESPEKASWRGLCVYVTPVGEPTILTVGMDGPIELDATACRALPTTEESP